jgi:hypothetical protein
MSFFGFRGVDNPTPRTSNPNAIFAISPGAPGIVGGPIVQPGTFTLTSDPGTTGNGETTLPALVPIVGTTGTPVTAGSTSTTSTGDTVGATTIPTSVASLEADALDIIANPGNHLFAIAVILLLGWIAHKRKWF